MTENNDHKLSDDELDALITGKHPVSAAYREMEEPSPSRDLDARILARARQSVAGDSGGRRDVFIRPYATAAMVLVCLGITFMLVNDPTVPTPADRRSEGQIIRREVPVDRTLEEQAPQAQLQRARVQQQAPQFSDDDANRSTNQAVAEAPADTDAAFGAGPARPEAAATESLEQLLDLVDQQRLTADSAERQPPEARSSQTAVRRDSLDEVVVTGSRIAGESQGYRDTRETWLEEIARLRAAGEPEAAEAEAALFLESYPGTDIDAALDALDIP